MTAMIIAKSDYIYKADLVYENLKEYEDVFRMEAIVIDRVKCMLVRNEELDDFSIQGIYVSVYHQENGYDLYFGAYHMKLVVYEKQIIDYAMERR